MAELGLVADLHMRESEASGLSAALRDVVDHWESNTPDHAFVLGDVIEDGENARADRDNLQRVREILERLPCDVTYLLGNHDVENLTRAELTDTLDQDRFRGVVELGDTSVIYLDSTMEQTPGARGALGPDQRQWLEAELRTHEQPLVLCHHPLGAFDISENVWFGDYPERAFVFDRKETLDVLDAGGPIRGTISGHIHQPGCGDFRGMTHVSLNAFSKETPELAITGTYAEVSIGDAVSIDVRVGDDRLSSHTIS